MKTFAILGVPLVAWNFAVADAVNLNAAVEIAKQVPALVVLSWVVNKFLATQKDRDDVFMTRIQMVAADFKESHDNSTKAVLENTKATTRLIGGVEKLEARL